VMVDAAVIKKTQDSLGKVIKKPPLTEKLLSKPPFRYLHDIISEVIKSTGFLEGLFEDYEKTSASVKEKDQKILFLQKAIDAVGLSIGSQLAARPSKVIAGQEPEKTNEFLQYLGRCAAKGADNEVVKRVKKGEKPGKKESGKDGNRSKERRSKDGEKKPKAGKERDSSKSKERVGSKERSKERVSGSSKERGSKERPERGRRERTKDDRKGKGQTKSSEKVTEKKDSSEERKKEKVRREEERAKEKEERRRRKEAEEEEKRRKQEEEAAAAQTEPAEITGEEPSTAVPQQQEAPEGDEETPLTNGFHEEDVPARIPRPSSAKGARRRPEPLNADPGEDSKRTYAQAVVGATTGEPPVPIMAGKRRERPTSARPAPPRIKKRDDDSTEDIAVREGSGRAPAGIIVDTNQLDDDDEMFVNEEPEETAAIKQPVIMGGSGGAGGQHGGLVQKIIDSQKQYSGPEKQDEKGPIMSQAARQKERAMTKKEIDQLRSGIQTLASSAAPLGKVLDYLQEDLDSMQKELETWRSENKYHETAIKAEESHMEKTLEPLRDQLEDTEQQIIDMINKINTMKCNIHNNDQKIGQMLSTMSFSTS